MATSPSSGESTGTGSNSPAPAPATTATPTGSSPADGLGPVTALGPVDTAVLNSAADRLSLIGEQLKVLQARAEALGAFVPTAGGRADGTWNTFVSQGYNGAVSGTIDSLTGLSNMVNGYGNALQQLSTLFTHTEHQNTQIAGEVSSAIEGAS